MRCARYFQNKYRCILVDEFQDTDPLQAEMIVRLCAIDGGEADWRRAKLRPGALFVVGDPEAVDLPLPPRRHRDVRRREAARLRRRSARSCRTSARREPIIDWVNRTFEQLIAEHEGVQPAYIALEHLPAYDDL